MPTLSLAMIVKDEERNLGKCLGSVQGCFDEIVIVDTGSRDRTKEIAQSFGVVIHDFEWIDDFAAARNFAFSKATCDFVMWLDADDILKPEDRKRLQDLRYKLGDVDAYAMRYDTARDEFGNCTQFFFRERIVRNTGQAKWAAPIHECLIIPKEWKHAVTNVTVTHDPSAEDIAHDPGRNIRLLRKAVEKYPEDKRLKFYLARELAHTGTGIQEAIERFQEYLKLDDWHENRVNAWLYLGISYWKNKEEEKAIESCMKGIQLDPRWAEYYTTIGQIYYDRKDWQKAIHWFEAATRCKLPDSWGFILQDNYTWVPWDRLCVAYWQVGERHQSYQANEKALKYRPKDARLISNREVMRDIMCAGRLAESPVRLNIGASYFVPSYRTCYPLPAKGVDEVFDVNEIPYEDSTVHALYCDRSVENLNGQEARDAFKEWARVLRHNGELVLKVTDLDLCCEGFLREEDREPTGNENVGPKEFFRHAIYGVSKSGLSPSEKRTTFTKSELRRLLETNGFEVASLRNLELDGIPSIEVRAYQKKKPIKISWLLSSANEADHETRVRRLFIHKYLELKATASKIYEKSQWKDKDEDLFKELKKSTAVVLTEAGEVEQKLANRLRKCGVAVIFDLSAETYISAKVRRTEVFLGRVLQSASFVVCASSGLQAMYQGSHRTCVIPDSYELAVEPIDHSYDAPAGKKLRVVWCGPSKEMENLDPLRLTISELGMELVTISDAEKADRKWKPGEWLRDLAEADIAVFPEPHWIKDSSVKSNFWVTQAQSMGLPVLASPVPSSKETLDQGKTGFLCESPKDWERNLALLKENASVREGLGRAARVDVRKHYALDQVAEKWLDLCESLSLEAASPPKVDIVIPTYNNLPYLKTCVESIRRTTAWSYNIIVVDSGDDDTYEWLKAQTDVISWKSPVRLHFSAATNAGIKMAKEKYLVMLNNDTIVSWGWLQAMMHEAMKPGAGAIGPFSNNEKQRLHNEPIMMKGKEIGWWANYEDVADLIPDIENYSHAKEVHEHTWISFYGTLFPRQVIGKVGLLDEEFKSGSEDVDYCRRIRLQGYRVLQTYDAFIFHFVSKTLRREWELNGAVRAQEDVRNRAHYDWKYGKPMAVFFTGKSSEKWSPKTLSGQTAMSAETLAANLAKELTAKGYRSFVFADCDGLDGNYDEVIYKDYRKFREFADANHLALMVAMGTPEVFENPIRAERKICAVLEVSSKLGRDLLEKMDVSFAVASELAEDFQKKNDVDPSRMLPIQGGFVEAVARGEVASYPCAALAEALVQASGYKKNGALSLQGTA